MLLPAIILQNTTRLWGSIQLLVVHLVICVMLLMSVALHSFLSQHLESGTHIQMTIFVALSVVIKFFLWHLDLSLNDISIYWRGS